MPPVCVYYTMTTNLGFASLRCQVYIHTKLVENLAKYSYYTMTRRAEHAEGIFGDRGMIISSFVYYTIMENIRQYKSILFKKHTDKLTVELLVRTIAHGQVYPCFFINYALMMRESVEACLAVVRADSACPHAAEAHV